MSRNILLGGAILGICALFLFRNTLLGLSAAVRSPTLATMFLALGADPNAVSGEHETPFHAAIDSEDSDVLALFLERGARINTPENLWNVNPVDYALLQGRKEAARFLRERGGRATEQGLPTSEAGVGGRMMDSTLATHGMME